MSKAYSTRPLITVGIACYRASATIEQAVLSAFAQDWDKIEVIIVDDFSNDGHESVLRALQERYPQLRIFYQTENKGVAASRNAIIRQARGEFLAFFDDDDTSHPSRLGKQYERIIKYEREFSKSLPVICHTARHQYYPDGSRHYEKTMGTNAGAVPNGQDVALRILTGKPQPHIYGSAATCSQMARVSLYRELGGFDEAFRRSEDTEFNVRAALAGAHFAGIAAALVHQTMTLSSDKKIADEKHYALKLLEKHRDFINASTDFRFCYAWLDLKYDLLQKRFMRFMLTIMPLFLKHPVLTAQRFLWALPNAGLNLRFSRFHHDGQ